jgi:hypothetical protein
MHCSKATAINTRSAKRPEPIATNVAARKLNASAIIADRNFVRYWKVVRRY